MSEDTFTVDQIAKLREIEKARINSGRRGLYEQLNQLMERLQEEGSGAVVESHGPSQAIPDDPWGALSLDERKKLETYLWDLLMRNAYEKMHGNLEAARILARRVADRIVLGTSVV